MAEEKQLPPEENIENYEEFDVVDDLYMPIYDQEEKYGKEKAKEQAVEAAEGLHRTLGEVANAEKSL